MTSNNSKLPSFFISHGFAGETLTYKSLTKYASENKIYEKVKTIIIISAHWEEEEVSVNLNPYPKLIHDHPVKDLYKYNFTFETDIELAQKVKKALEDNKIATKTSSTYGLDHGAWGGLFCFYDIKEQAKAYSQNKKQHVPKVVQVSLHAGMDFGLHYKIGQILNQFRDESTTIIASGASTHSFKYMNHPEYLNWAKEWEKWLQQVVTNNDQQKRKEELMNVHKHKMYSYIHHSDDHFIPMLVAIGTSQYPGELLCVDQLFNFTASSYSFK